MEDWVAVPCSVYRGGTSKGVFILGSNLPEDPEVRDKVILHIFGSPDGRQINGLGGGTPTTSKLAIVSLSKRDDADVDYTFGQVSIDQAVIDYRPNCGNISSGVGPFAVESGLVHVAEDEAVVRIYNTNTDTLITSRFSVQDGHFLPDGDTTIAGVPGTASKIVLAFHQLGGGVTGQLLPTEAPLDIVTLQDGRQFHVTVIDAGNLTVVMDAIELGLQGTEVSEKEMTRRQDVLTTMEEVRQVVGRRLNLYGRDEIVTPETHALPKIAFVTEPRTYSTNTGQVVGADEIDIVARVLTMGTLHPSYAVTGAIALAVASKIDGTVVSARTAKGVRDLLRIGHPSGTLEAGANVVRQGDKWVAESVSLVRTARPIMDGAVWVPEAVFKSTHVYRG